MIAALLLAASSAGGTVSVPVLLHPVERGAILSPADFEVQERASGLASGALTVAEVAGRETTRALPAGMIVRKGDTLPPRLVRRGEPVTISWRSSGLSITTAGRALTSAGIGEPARVIATSTGRTLDGVVEGSGQVRLSGGGF